jgi:predicted Holliday junction resolvase-like endonuclease
LRQEQEDEIKRLNEVKINCLIGCLFLVLILSYFKLILNVKVHAIRDAQVVEKKQIKKEVKDEEKRLDLMMEVERVNAIKIQEEIEKKRKHEMKQ